MINNIIEVKCKCGETIKINVKSITKLQEKIEQLESEIFELKQNDNLSNLKNIFGFKE